MRIQRFGNIQEGDKGPKFQRRFLSGNQDLANQAACKQTRGFCLEAAASEAFVSHQAERM